jgi:glycolate dehydrogenase FAD-binding subunit
MTEDFIASLCERVKDAGARHERLRIRGGGTKDFYGGALAGEALEVGAYSGIVAYEPKELVLTVRAGTPLAEVERTLAAERQMLPFEPPHFATGATIGGIVATGLSGPRRPYAGAVRDFVLGTRIVNGKGEDLSFGGRVIKNVAGYDVSRLMAGALGTLGVLTEISFKVLPQAPAEATLAFELDELSATAQSNRWAGQPLPLSATSWEAGVLRVRLSGAASAVRAAKERMGGQDLGDASAYWTELREHRLAFFKPAVPLWRVSVPQTTAPLDLGGPQLVEWGGGLRWLAANVDPQRVRGEAQRAGGHATLFRGGDKSVGVFHPLAPAILKIHRRLKAAFDPAGILNAGRLYDF